MDPLYNHRQTNVAFKIDNSARGNAYVVGAPFCYLPTSTDATGPEMSRAAASSFYMSSVNNAEQYCLQQNMDTPVTPPVQLSATEIINALLMARGKPQQPQPQPQPPQPQPTHQSADPVILAPGTVVTRMDQWVPFTGTVHSGPPDITAAPEFRFSQTFMDTGGSIVQHNVQLTKDTSYRTMVTAFSALPNESCTLGFEISTSDYMHADGSHETFDATNVVELFARTFIVPATGLYHIRYVCLKGPLIIDTPIVHVN